MAKPVTDRGGNDALPALCRLWSEGIGLRCYCTFECASFRKAQNDSIPVQRCNKGRFTIALDQAEAVLPDEWPDEWDDVNVPLPGEQSGRDGRP